MSFKEDFDKLKCTWKELSLTWKIVLGTMILLQAMSIASIGKSVHEFKGFINKGIELYHALTAPLIHWLPIPNLDRELFDFITLTLLFAGTVLRSVNLLPNKSYVLLTLVFLISTMLFPIFGIGPDYSNTNIWSILLAVCLFSYLSKSWTPLYIFIIPFILISTLAAISQGLSYA